MAKTSVGPSRDILEAALQGLEAQRQKLEDQISEVRSMLGRRVGRPPKGGSGSNAASETAAPAKREGLSAEARKRIAAAQKKRWAAYRKSQKTA